MSAGRSTISRGRCRRKSKAAPPYNTGVELGVVQPEGPHCDWPAWEPPVDVPMVGDEGRPCSYLPGKLARTRAFWGGGMGGELYQRFMDAGFRRSGKVVYQPVCPGCRACLPIRVPVESFRPSKSQRRCWRRNSDVLVTVDRPEATGEKFELYGRYQDQWHGKTPAEEGDRDQRWASFASFLYDSPVETAEFLYRDAAGKLLGAGLCDLSLKSLSSVYFYFDPAEARRGLGTYSAMYEIAQARRLGLPYYYLGYWVRGCAAMEYKANFRPCEVLWPDGQWRRGLEEKYDEEAEGRGNNPPQQRDEV